MQSRDDVAVAPAVGRAERASGRTYLISPGGGSHDPAAADQFVADVFGWMAERTAEIESGDYVPTGTAEEIDAGTTEELVASGFARDSVEAAIAARDLSLLVHSGRRPPLLVQHTVRFTPQQIVVRPIRRAVQPPRLQRPAACRRVAQRPRQHRRRRARAPTRESDPEHVAALAGAGPR
jgi:hypothetical protein